MVEEETPVEDKDSEEIVDIEREIADLQKEDLQEEQVKETEDIEAKTGEGFDYGIFQTKDETTFPENEETQTNSPKRKR